ncbi:DUF4245 domain-containing protein [Saccharopolyspora sp. K220]|uniref:DUF4245 domain-containing protein n=1 Tax=Saccharopolyspora soli TaxID=2926618 RepID=UPI001F582E58|nr:DUF4245 domain-containing protein [Saccharopolyspora soli]MCI2421629.1 DUF4245 domain-containing protein [Saccharopolyspora soli]
MGVVAEPGNQQPAPSRPPRTASAMVFAILPLVLVAFGVAGLVGQCSFNPGGPSIEGGPVPTVDVPGELRDAAERVDFPVREPNLPADWRANSANVTTLGSHAQVVRVGWLTGGARYLRLAQSTASEEELVTAETRQPPHAEGTVDVAGRQWVSYESVRGERAWVSERDGVRLLITGNADEPEFRTLAEAAIAAPAIS